MNFLRKYQNLSGLSLKLLAVITMVIDHSAHAFFDPALPEQAGAYMLLVSIGRLAFPIFAFLIAEGAINSSDPQKYGKRLLVFALISEVPYDLLFHGSVLEFTNQNILFTLAAGLCAIMLYRNARRKWSEGAKSLLATGAVVLMLILAQGLGFDYGWQGVGLIFAFYLWRTEWQGRPFYGFLLMLVFGYLWWGYVQVLAVLGFLPLFLYNGTRGKAVNKYIFYGFYPAHLLVLLLLRLLIFGSGNVLI